MENDQLNNLFELELTEEGKSNFASIGQWAYINAIVGFVAIGVTILSTVMMTSRLGSYGTPGAGPNFVSVLISAIISILLNVTLITAASNLKKGISLSDQGHFNMGLSKLATYFRILGILMIILLVIVVLAVLIILIAGSSKGGF